MAISPCDTAPPGHGRLALGLEAVARPENPGDDRQADDQEDRHHEQAGAYANVREAVKAPAEAAHQVDDRIKERRLLPERWQHGYAVEAAAEKGQRQLLQHIHAATVLAEGDAL